MLKLISNDKRRNHGQLLQGWLNGCDNGFVAVAFLKQSGLKQIEQELRGFLRRGGYLQFVVGTDFFITEPEALRTLLKLGCDFPRFEWKMARRTPGSTFHPKYYRFRGGGRIWVLTGSANLTLGGLEHNIEVSTIAEDAANGLLATESERIETAIWSHERCSQPAETGVESYAVRYKVNKRCMTEAADRVEQELKDLQDMEGKALEDALQVYRSDADQEEDLKKRKSNYELARLKISDHWLGSPESASTNFDVVYEALVGKVGTRPLWHSGSVNRRKGEVIKNKDAVVRMVHEIAKNLDRTPQEMYEIRVRWTPPIRGLGPNIFTEFCNTLRPDRYAILNKNSVKSLSILGIRKFPSPTVFKSEEYGIFCEFIEQIAKRCGFHDLGEVDHFLNFVYQCGKKKSAVHKPADSLD